MTGNAREFDMWISHAEQAMASGRKEDAVVFFDRALAMRPRDIQALNAKGALLGGLRRFDEAIAAFEAAAVESPDSAELQYNIAFAHQSQGRFQEAIASYDRAIALRPNYPEALTNRALSLASLGRYDEAVASAEAAVRLNPDDARLLNNLGHAQFRQRNLEGARRSFEAALRIAPGYVDARANLAPCLLQMGMADEAVLHFEAALAVSPGHARSLEGLALAYRTLERYAELESTCRRLTALAPRAATPWVELGAILATLDRGEEAYDCFRRAIALEPQSADVHARIGQAQLELGKLEDAEVSLDKACELEPRSPYFLYVRAGIGNPSAAPRLLDRFATLDARSADLDPADRAYLHFGFAKTLSDLGDNERSFSRLIEANRTERGRRAYDEGATLTLLSAIGKAFSPELIARCRAGGDASQSPIFIVGMPRSGSTLVEQMLAAHKDAIALGELRAFQHVVHAIDKAKGSKFPDWFEKSVPGDVRAIAEGYAARLRTITEARGDVPTAGRRIVDKMLGNFLYVGLIHLALPNARIIHTRRDPVDTCLSCYRQLFNEAHFSYDLAELGRYYRGYERLMARWSELLPEDAVLHVDHEALVADFEGGARRIISYCGLEWDDACLSFQDVKRSVRTASVLQVRQPLMAGRKSWRPSDEILRPLLDELGR